MEQRSVRTEEKQAIRLHRYTLGLYSYSLALALLGTADALGFIHTPAAVTIAIACIAANTALFVLFRSGFNLRFADPSLTKLQVYLGITLLMLSLYHVDVGRGISLGLCFLVFLFGIFRLSTRELMTLALYTLAAYALVINLLMHWRPESIQNVQQEWFNWALLALSLPWFSMIGGRIRELRDRLRERKQELQDAIGTIQAMATRDEVTGLFNRAFFTESLGHALAQAERHERSLALLFIDVDRFKLINDSLGHVVGDEALRKIGARIAGCVRGSDIVARLGGDEFAALIESVAAPLALHEVAQKIIEAVARPLELEQRELALSVSIGVAAMPDDGRDVQTLMRNADIAMYRAKAHGRNRYSFYTRQMSERAEERLALEADLHRAAQRGELRVLYQPKVGVADGGIRGAEALLRWQHPRLGLLAPDRFIDLAEETGAIVPIGRWVLKEACARAAAWDGSYSIAVNLSARQFSDPGLLATVEEALRESGLDPALLELEITESMVMLEPEAAAQTMRKLRALGTRLSMDDFGTGYSSLGYLKRFPITTVKLDRSFVRDLPDHEDDVAIARAVLAMAHSLRMDVTAEGVETGEQLEFLRREGCLAYQGYYCSPPVAEEQLLALLETMSTQRRRVRAIESVGR
ncbi:MAG: EAL domain-containing protein [Betaproteobacteria bacterium]|nr:MAG: EAL domain-containing protein [Betaproteobacteria bacterium]